MDNNTYSVGIDISKEKLDICVLQGRKVIYEVCIENSPRALLDLHKRLKKQHVSTENSLFCCEHTGIYASNLMTWSSEYGYKLWVEKPMQIKKSIGMQRGKNDKIDAQRIAEYAFRYQDKAVIFERPRKEIEELKHLLTTRQRLLKTKKQIEVPLKELKPSIDKKMYKHIESCTRDSLKGVKSSLKKIDQRVLKIVREDQKLSKFVALSTSVDGIGVTTATSLIVATNEFKNVSSGKQMACYVE